MKDRIKQLLIGGLKASEVASIVGCTPAYVSQLMADNEFKKEVEASRVLYNETKTEEQHIEQRYQNLEHKLISSIGDDLPNADFGQKLRALDIVGRRYDERRKIRIPTPDPSSASGHHTTNYTLINIGLPDHIMNQAAPVIEMNENKEILAINNKVLAPMSSDGVKNIFAQLQHKKKMAALQLEVIDPKIIEEL